MSAPGDAVEKHVQLTDGPRGGVVDLAAQPDVGGITTGLLDELATDDEHTSGAAAWIVDAQPRLGFKNADHEPDNIARCVEVSAFFARRFGKHVDEELIGGAEQVGKLKVFVSQPVFVEMTDQIFAGVVGNNPLVALHAHEADVVEDVFE